MNQFRRGLGEKIRRKKEERIGGAGRERRSGIGEGNRGGIFKLLFSTGIDSARLHTPYF